MRARDLLTRIRISGEVFVWRHGLMWPLFGLASAAVAGLAGLAHLSLSRQAEDIRHEAAAVSTAESKARAARQAVSPERSTADERQAQLRAVLVPRVAAGAQVERIYKLAERHGVGVTEADFRDDGDGAGIGRLQMAFPAKARYPQFRRFIEDVLREHANVSLDRITFKRRQVGDTQVEAQVALSLWLQGPAPAPAAKTASASEDAR